MGFFGTCVLSDICVLSERPIARSEVIVTARVVGGLDVNDHAAAPLLSASNLHLLRNPMNPLCAQAVHR